MTEQIIDSTVEDELSRSYMEYGMSVIISRALPDVRDGLKPVHRRILYSMYDLGVRPDRAHVKCAKVVGDTMGRFHPHGDLAIYESLVRLAQFWSMRVPLIDPHGNFGSLDDGPAASRYTECRLSPAGMALLDDIRESTVDFVPSYDNSDTEPTVLPSAFPNLLVNGSQGIAVGMATNIAPHNLREVTAALQAMLENPNITLDEIMVHLPGPDFPTGALLYQLGGVRDAYATGKGAFRLRARSRIVEVSSRKRGLEFTEMPYQVSPEKVIARIKSLLGQKKLQGVADAKDLTDRKSGIRLLVECKTGFSPEAVLASLYRLTDLDVSFSINTVCLVDGNPQTLGLLDLCRYFLEHRRDVVTRRTRFRLEKAEARCHIIDGILIALAAIEEVVAILKGSKDTDIARKKLMSTFKLSEIQVQHIIEMPLRRLVGLEITKLKAELRELKTEIAAYNKILKDPKEMKRVISEELGATAQLYGVDRASELVTDLAAPEEIVVELEPDEPCVIALSLSGTIARFPLSAKKGSLDPQRSILTTSVRAKIAAITSLGRAHSIDVAELALVTKKGRGNPTAEYVELLPGEEVVGLVPIGAALALATRSGVLKRLDPTQFPTRLPAVIIKLDDNDVVVGAGVGSDETDLIMVSDDAQLLRTPSAKIRPQGRSAAGVQGMKLSEGANVIAFSAVVVTDQVLVTMSDQGAVKLTPLSEYPAKGRNGIGVRCQRLLSGETNLADAMICAPQEAVAVDSKDQAITGDLPRGRRDGSGVRLNSKPTALARHLLASN
jgi:DNA gyrase subunit A